MKRDYITLLFTGIMFSAGSNASTSMTAYSISEVVSVGQVEVGDTLCLSHMDLDVNEQKGLALDGESVVVGKVFSYEGCLENKDQQWEVVVLPDTIGYEKHTFGARGLRNASNNSFLVSINDGPHSVEVFSLTEDRLYDHANFFPLSIFNISRSTNQTDLGDQANGSLISVSYPKETSETMLSGYNTLGHLFVADGKLRANGIGEVSNADYLKVYKINDHQVSLSTN